MSHPTNIVFKKSPIKGKKYQVEFTYRGRNYKRHFGATGYEQYKDSTPLRLYAKWDHGNYARRKKYYERHGEEKSPLSARYWANKYLW